MIKNLSIAFILLFLTCTSFSQDAPAETKDEAPKVEAADPTKGKHYLGLNVGSASGIGFSYKYVKNRFGFQFSGIPIFANDELWASTGIALTLRSKESLTSSSRFAPLLYFGAHIITERRQQYELNYDYYYYYDDYGPYDTYSSEKVTEITLFSSALGFGFDYKIDEHFLLNFMTGYALYYTGNFSTNFAGELGLHYRM
jgi:hypothetical protein